MSTEIVLLTLFRSLRTEASRDMLLFVLNNAAEDHPDSPHQTDEDQLVMEEVKTFLLKADGGGSFDTRLVPPCIDPVRSGMLRDALESYY